MVKCVSHRNDSLSKMNFMKISRTDSLRALAKLSTETQWTKKLNWVRWPRKACTTRLTNNFSNFRKATKLRGKERMRRNHFSPSLSLRETEMTFMMRKCLGLCLLCTEQKIKNMQLSWQIKASMDLEERSFLKTMGRR